MTPMKLTLLSLSALLCASCAFAPGSHIDTKSSLFEDSNNEFSEADLSKLVATHSISPMLLAELNTPNTAPQFNEQLQAALGNYDYQVGKGDVLLITVWNHPELTIPAGSMRNPIDAGNWVHNDGTIFYPYVGKVKVEGLKVTEIRDILAKKLAKYIESPQVDVTVAGFRSQRVYVTGEVNKPGVLPVTNVPMTLIEAVSAAGGLNPEADWTNVTLTRNGQERQFNLRELYQQGNTDQNILLQPDRKSVV